MKSLANSVNAIIELLPVCIYIPNLSATKGFLAAIVVMFLLFNTMFQFLMTAIIRRTILPIEAMKVQILGLETF